MSGMLAEDFNIGRFRVGSWNRRTHTKSTTRTTVTCRDRDEEIKEVSILPLSSFRRGDESERIDTEYRRRLSFTPIVRFRTICISESFEHPILCMSRRIRHTI